MNGFKSTIWIIFTALLWPLQGYSVEPINGEPGQRVSSPSASLELCSTGAVEVLGLFHIADAALYLPSCEKTESILGPIPKQYSITATRELSGKRLAKNARKLLKRNLDRKVLAEAGAAFHCLNQAYETIQAGERYDIRYDPKDGLSLIRNGELLSNCPSPDAGAQYFAIWFGKKPLNSELRDQLLTPP